MCIIPLLKTVLHGKITETDRDGCWSSEAGTNVISTAVLVSSAVDLKLLKVRGKASQIKR